MGLYEDLVALADKYKPAKAPTAAASFVVPRVLADAVALMRSGVDPFTGFPRGGTPAEPVGYLAQFADITTILNWTERIGQYPAGSEIWSDAAAKGQSADSLWAEMVGAGAPSGGPTVG